MVWLEILKPVAVAAVGTPVSYAPYKDTNYDDAIAYVWGEEDGLISAEARKTHLEKSGITLTRNYKGGHGIGSESREEVLSAVIELVEIFKERASR